jgi:hypothetical protein
MNYKDTAKDAASKDYYCSKNINTHAKKPEYAVNQIISIKMMLLQKTITAIKI